MAAGQLEEASCRKASKRSPSRTALGEAFGRRPPFPFRPHPIARQTKRIPERALHGADNTITFYDLARRPSDDQPIRVGDKYALKHKGFDLEVVTGGFTRSPSAPAARPSGCRRSSTTAVGTRFLGHRRIPRRTYPTGELIPHPSVAIVTRALDAWFWAWRPGRGCAATASATATSQSRDHEYITHCARRCSASRSRRSGRLGGPAGRHLGRARAATHRAARGEVPRRDTPNYADYRILGSICSPPRYAGTPRPRGGRSAASVDRQPLDMYGGLGRHPGCSSCSASTARKRSAAVHCRRARGHPQAQPGPDRPGRDAEITEGRRRPDPGGRPDSSSRGAGRRRSSAPCRSGSRSRSIRPTAR